MPGGYLCARRLFMGQEIINGQERFDFFCFGKFWGPRLVLCIVGMHCRTGVNL